MLRLISSKRQTALIAVLTIAGCAWLATLICEGRVRIPDSLTTRIVNMADGPRVPTPKAGSLEVTVVLGDSPKSVVDARFLSVAIDTSLVVGGHWWSAGGTVEAVGHERVAPIDLTNAILRDLARALEPAYLRIGGTEADKLSYAVQSPSVEHAPDKLVLTRAQWERLTEFVRSAHFDLFFTLNAGPSQRDSSQQWKGDNAEQLLRYAQSHTQPISVVEFGNEINGYWFNHGLSQQPSGALIANDLKTLRTLVNRYAPNARVASPGEFYWPRLGSPLASQTHVLSELLEADRGRNLDAITWHYYPQQSRRCPVATRRASLTELLDPASLDEITRWSDQISALRDACAPNAPIWLSETGNAQCGGEPGVSDRYVSSLWWMDQLGLLAVHGQSVVVRQALVGSDYGMLDDKTLQPRPDYFVSLLHKHLMGQIVINVHRNPEADPYLRVYAHCSAQKLHKQRGAVTLMAINLHPNQNSVLIWPSAAARDVDCYLITSPALDSSVALLNGQRMTIAGRRSVLEPQTIRFDGAYTLPPASIVFLVADARAAACISSGA